MTTDHYFQTLYMNGLWRIYETGGYYNSDEDMFSYDDGVTYYDGPYGAYEFFMDHAFLISSETRENYTANEYVFYSHDRDPNHLVNFYADKIVLVSYAGENETQRLCRHDDDIYDFLMLIIEPYTDTHPDAESDTDTESESDQEI